MTFDGVTSHQAASRPEVSATTFAYYFQAAIALTVLGVGAVVGSLLIDLKEILNKQNDLTSQQIAVTRSMHHVQELATAYVEGRRASQAAEEAGIPSDPVERQRPEQRSSSLLNQDAEF